MMRWKPLLLVGVVAVLAGLSFFFLRHRGGPAVADPPAAKTAARPRIALVLKSLTNPFFADMEKGARRAEAQIGFELLAKSSTHESSAEQQVNIVDELTRAKVDAIVISPADSYRMIPVLKKARSEGIVVVTVDTRLDPEAMRKADLSGIPFISVNNEAGAYKAVKYLIAGVHAPTEAAIIEGHRSASTAQDRKQGALRAFAENPQVTVVASETANWRIGEAYDVARIMFTAHPRIQALFCANDLMALGAIRYLQEAGLKSVKVVSFDGQEEARAAIRAGTLAATVDQQPGEQGFTAVTYASRMLKGESLPEETLLDTKLITSEGLGSAPPAEGSGRQKTP